MTVAELIEKLKEMPQDAHVLAEGEDADKVVLEQCDGNRYVRIFKAWDVEFTGLYADDELIDKRKVGT